MATLKQQLAFKNTLDNHGNLRQAMREAGYSEAMAKNPKYLTDSKGWREMLQSLVCDELIVARVVDIAFQDDKRASLQAIDMLLKLKDRYPAGKLKVQEYNEELQALLE